MTMCENDTQCNGNRVCTKYGECDGSSGCTASNWLFVSNGIYVNGLASNAQLDKISLLQVNSCSDDLLTVNKYEDLEPEVPEEGWTITEGWESLDQIHQLEEGECLNSIKVWKDELNSQFIGTIEFGSNRNEKYLIG